MFSKACMYAIRALVLMASTPNSTLRWTLGRIVSGTGAPEAFMAKILQKLVHSGIILSVKGPGGGFSLAAKHARTLKLADVVTVMDGDTLFKGCALGFPKCNGNRPCPIHAQVVLVRERLKGVLNDTLIRDLGKDLGEGHAFLKGKL